MASAREQILSDIRRTLPVESPLPAIEGTWITSADPHEQFFEVLRGVGGAGRIVEDQTALRTQLQELIERIGANRICSVLPEAFEGNIEMASIDDPHNLADVDLAILPGELAVAENAAVWVNNDRVSQRVAYFLSQHVALVVPRERIVDNMHEAYQWLRQQGGELGPFHQPRWGTFMSGPSKTADIEQALVIGAHGARSLNVFFI